MTHDVGAGAGGLSPGDLSPGERVAAYQIAEQIGRGGMAVVYRALDLRLNRTVALKVLAPALCEDDAFRERFMRESRAAARVEHPHIIPVFDAGEVDGLLYIAMRYFGLGDVRRLLDAERTLSPERVTVITAQVASALDAAHAHGLVHRDVKPGNILLGESDDDSDCVFLADFGLSKHSLTPSTLTSTGQFMGTLDYVAPEQIQGRPVDGRADQYALACTVIEMLAGSPPFRHDETKALLWAQLEAPPPRLTLQRPDLPAAVDAVIMRAMAKSPAERFPTCRHFAEALHAAFEPGSSAPGYRAQARPDEVAVFPAFGRERGTRHPGAGTGSDMPGASRAAATRLDPVPSQTRGAEGGRRGTQWGATSWRHGIPRYGSELHGGELHGRQRQRPASPPRLTLRAVLVAIAVLAALAALSGAGYKLFGHAAAAPRSVPTNRPRGASHGSPAATVEALFAAINKHDYAAAWKLSDDTGSETFSQFEAGFAQTAHDTVTILSINGDVVRARLIAKQTDGTVKYFRGTYTVVGGVIVAAKVHLVT